MMEYICSVTLLQKKSNRVKSCDLPGLLNIAAAVSKVSSSLKTTRDEAYIYSYNINKIQTQTNQPAVTAKILSQPGIQLCVASVAVQSGKQPFMGYTTDFPGLFNIHVSSEHRSYCDQPHMRTIFQLHYGAVNRSPNQQMCQCLATAAIALCLYAVQHCGCKIILRERK